MKPLMWFKVQGSRFKRRRRRPAALIRGLALLLALAAPAAAQGILPSFGEDRAGTSGFQMLKIPIDPRSSALGEAVVSNAFDASALFWNPALAAEAGRAEVGLAHTAYYAGVTLNSVAAMYPVGRFTVGASLQALTSGEMDVTTEFEPLGTGETFQVTDLALGLTVAQKLTDLFSYGVTGKFVQEGIAGINARTVVFDLGLFYRIGTSGVQMAVAIRNFGLDAVPGGSIERIVIGGEGSVVEDEFESLTPPTTFLLGATYDVFGQRQDSRLQLSGQLTRPNDHAESLNLGVEYTWRDLLTLRTGYRLGVEGYTTPGFGAGVRVPGLPAGLRFRFDYGYSRLTYLGSVHRAGVNFGF